MITLVGFVCRIGGYDASGGISVEIKGVVEGGGGI
jgi:hypothetical protein